MKTIQNIKRIEDILQHDDYPDEDQKQHAVAQLMADLMHYCDEHVFNFWELEDLGVNWYKEERL
jgi:hypothetical protein